MAVKVVAWDVYQTIVAPYCEEVRDDMDDEPLRIRQGVREGLEYFDSKSVFQVTCSDCDSENVKRDLKTLEVLGYFLDFFPMTPYFPKDFTGIRDFFGVNFQDLLVIGDNYDLDIVLAKQQGCKTIHLPLDKKLTLEDIVQLVG